jgi:hypothetical protein
MLHTPGMNWYQNVGYRLGRHKFGMSAAVVGFDPLPSRHSALPLQIAASTSPISINFHWPSQSRGSHKHFTIECREG